MEKKWGEVNSSYTKIDSYIGLRCPVEVVYYKETRQPGWIECQIFRWPKAGDINVELWVSWMNELMVKSFNTLLHAFCAGHWPDERFITPNMPVLNTSDAQKPSDLQARGIYGQLLLICSCSNTSG